MAQIFISYARADRPRIESLAAALTAAGHSVWWDRHIRGGASFSKDIETQLEKADAIVVVWSPQSKESDWVKDEAVYGRDKGCLIPVCLSTCEAPLGFRQYQTLDFEKWQGDPSAPEIDGLLEAIAGLTGGEHQSNHNAPTHQFFSQKLLSDKRYLAGAASLVIAVLATMFFLGRETGETAPALVTDLQEEGAAGDLEADHAPSIAVLPFADLSPEGDQEYFADGLSEELLNVLVRVDGLKVASRTSAFALKGEVLSISDIAERLDVNHVLEGSIRKMDNRVRITAQLIDASTDKHLWSETYDRHLSDIFRIQDEIATAVVEELREELGMSEDAPIEIKPVTQDLNAYDAYLKARELYLARGKANVAESMRLFEHAVDLDPNFAKGWEGLAGVYAIATSWGIGDRDYSAMSLTAAKQALAIDPNLSAPYAVIGLTYRTHYPTPWAESISNLQKAVELDPKSTDSRLWLGMNYLAVGEIERSIEIFNGCLEVDNAVKLCRKYRSIGHLILGNEDKAIADATENAEVGYYSDFDAYLPYFLKNGDRLLAFTISRTVNWWSNFPHREFIAAVEDPDSASAERVAKFTQWGANQNVNIKNKTYLNLTIRSYGNLVIENWNNDYETIWLPQFLHYRQSPEFKQLMTDLGTVDYWREFGFPPQCEAVGEDDWECVS